MNARPLAGIRIVDLTFVVAGPVATSLLASLGAEVIKIENTVPRSRRETVLRPQRNANFYDLNRGKQAITLNLNVPAAKEVFLKLVQVSDVVIDNFSPRVMRNFGLEYQDLVKVKPDIIQVAMPAFGTTGPLRDRGSFGPGIDAMSGLCHLTGYPDGTPLKPGNYYCDFNAGVHAALAVMAGVFHKRRTGRGQFIEVAMRDGETQLIGEYILDFVLNGRVQERASNFHPTMAPHNVYRCRGEDNWLAIAVETDFQWAALCDAMDRRELAAEPRFATAMARKRNEEAVDAAVSSWAAGQDHIQAMHCLQAAGVPAAAVLSTPEIARDPQFAHRQVFQQVELADGRRFTLGRVAWLAERARSLAGRPPEYSEHTYRVLHDLIQLTEAEIESLAAEHAIVLPGAESVEETS